MKNLNDNIEAFFDNESFSPRELQDFRNKIRLNCLNKSEKKVYAIKIRNKLGYFIKLKVESNSFKKKYIYVKRECLAHFKKSQDQKKDTEKDNLDKLRYLTNLDLAKKINIEYSDLIRVLKKIKIENIDKESIITDIEFSKIEKFAISRLKTIERKKKYRLRREFELKKTKNKKRKLKNKSNLPGVYGKIQKQGGIGKLIYNSMRK